MSAPVNGPVVGYSDVGSCPRCSQRHEEMKFVRLHQTTKPEWTHWALCPGTGEPLFARTSTPVNTEVER